MSHNAPLTQPTTAVEPRQIAAFDQFLTYCALGGLIVSEEGKIEKLTLTDFCMRTGIDRKTTWRWKNSPGFAMKVRERRDEVVPLARETMAFNQLFILGMQTQDKRAAVDALKTYLGHFSNLRLPTVKQEIEVKNKAADLLTAAKEDGIIEGEVVYEPTDHAGTDGQDPGALSLPS